jgi:ubiquinone/menaquinone biosynthesis C-methylase UbiE
MLLDYEEASDEERDRVYQKFNYFGLKFIYSGKRFELHERILKPELELFEGARIAELGFGEGYHLESYRDLDYRGFDTNFNMLSIASRNTRREGVFSLDLQFMAAGNIPLLDKSMDRLFSVCMLHEAEDMERELAEMNRVVVQNGKIVIVERMCAIEESARAIQRLKDETRFLPEWFSGKGYEVNEKRFKATYWGENLDGDLMFNFYLIAGRKK